MSETARTPYSPQEAAAFLGFGIATVRRRLADGTLPRFQPGGPGTRIAIPLAALESLAVSIAGSMSLAETAEATSRDPAHREKRLSGRQPRWMSNPSTAP